MHDQAVKDAPEVEDSPDFYLPCLLALIAHLDKPMSEAAIRSRVADHEEGWDWPRLLDAVESLGFGLQQLDNGLSSLRDSVAPVLVRLKSGGAALLMPSAEGDAPLILWPLRSMQEEDWPVESLFEDSDGMMVAITPATRVPQSEEHLPRGRMGHWFWGPLLSAKPMYVQVALAALLTNVFALSTSIFSMIVYDRVIPHNATDTLIALLIGISLVLLSDFAIRTLRGYFLDVAGARADAIIADTLFEHVMDIEMSARRGSVGALANVLKEYESIREFLTSATLTTVIDIPFALLFLIVIATIGGPLAMVLVIIIPIMVLASLAVQPQLRRLVQTSFEDGQSKHSVLVETLSGLETVKALGAAGQMRKRWQKAIAHQAQIGLKTRMLSQFAGNVANLGSQVSTVAIVAVGVYLARDGSIGTGAIVACSMLAGRAISPLAQLAQLLTRVNQSLASYKALKDLMSQPREHAPNTTYIPRQEVQGAIELREVSFRYAGQQSGGLDKVSLRIEPGEKVAIIGRVGSGKTTLSKLILGLQKPTEGAVLVDGCDLRQFDKADLRKNFGTVLQEIWLMSGTVRHNIALGAVRPSQKDILRAAELAGVHDFLATHPDGYNLKLSERGEGLSGGQRQAIAIARALVGQPAVLIMDEPTSAMDVNAEKLLIQRLKDHLQKSTLIVITHKGTLLELVDRVIVMEQGRVVADGPKDKVLNPQAHQAAAAASPGPFAAQAQRPSDPPAAQAQVVNIQSVANKA